MTLRFLIAIFLACTAQAQIFGTLSSLQRFPVYQTCDAAVAAGVACPTYSSAKPVKSWVDLSPPQADNEGNVRYLSICLARDRKTPAARDGKPYLCEFSLPAEEAGRVNIPLKDFTGKWTEQARMYEYPVPMRALAADEELYFGFGGLPMARKAQAVTPAPASGSSADTARLEQLLIEVLSKIDVLLATTGNK